MNEKKNKEAGNIRDCRKILSETQDHGSVSNNKILLTFSSNCTRNVVKLAVLLSNCFCLGDKHFLQRKIVNNNDTTRNFPVVSDIIILGNMESNVFTVGLDT